MRVQRTAPGAVSVSFPPEQAGTTPETAPAALVDTVDFTFTLPQGEALAKVAYSWSDISGLTLAQGTATCTDTPPASVWFACPSAGQSSIARSIFVPKLQGTLYVKGWDRAGNATTFTLQNPGTTTVVKGRDVANIKAGHQWSVNAAGTAFTDVSTSPAINLSTTGTFVPNAMNPNDEGETLLQLNTAQTASTPAAIDLSKRFSMGGGFTASATGTDRVLLRAVSGGSGIEVVHAADGKVRARVLSGGVIKHEVVSSKAVAADTWFYPMVAWSPVDKVLQLTVAAAGQATTTTDAVDTTVTLSGAATLVISDATRSFQGFVYRPVLISGLAYGALARALLTGSSLSAVQ